MAQIKFDSASNTNSLFDFLNEDNRFPNTAANTADGIIDVAGIDVAGTIDDEPKSKNWRKHNPQRQTPIKQTPIKQTPIKQTPIKQQPLCRALYIPIPKGRNSVDDNTALGGQLPPDIALISDPLLLLMMMTDEVLSSSSHTATSLMQQLQRATDVQAVLRDKRVKEYQQQIIESVNASSRQWWGELVSTLFDVVMCVVDLALAAEKLAEGYLTLNPLDAIDAGAYLLAGFAGMLKVGADVAMLAGADKKKCESLISSMTVAQTSLESVGIILDLVKIGLVSSAIRSLITPAIKTVLKDTAVQGFKDVLLRGAEEGSRALVSDMASKVAEDVFENIERNVAEDVDKEILEEEASEMASSPEGETEEAGEASETGDSDPTNTESETAEAQKRENKATERRNRIEAEIESKLSPYFSKGSLKNAIENGLEQAFERLLEAGQVAEEEIAEQIFSCINDTVFNTIYHSIANRKILTIKNIFGGFNKAFKGMIQILSAISFKKIELLMAQQNFIKGTEESMESRKKTEGKQLQAAYQNANICMQTAMRVIDNYGSTLSNMIRM